MTTSNFTKLALCAAILGGGAFGGQVFAADTADRDDQNLINVKKDAGAYNASADKSTVAPNTSERGSNSDVELETSGGSTAEESRQAATYSTEAYDDTGDASSASAGTSAVSSADTSRQAANSSTEAEAPYQVRFDFDSAELSDDARSALDELAKQLKDEERPVTVAISGHTDTSGPEEYNKDLAERRAKAVQEYLKDKELEISNWEVQAPGPEQPVASNETREGRQENRRVEIQVSGSGREVSAVTE